MYVLTVNNRIDHERCKCWSGNVQTAEVVVYLLHLEFSPAAFNVLQIDDQTADVDFVIRSDTTHVCTWNIRHDLEEYTVAPPWEMFVFIHLVKS